MPLENKTAETLPTKDDNFYDMLAFEICAWQAGTDLMIEIVVQSLLFTQGPDFRRLEEPGGNVINLFISSSPMLRQNKRVFVPGNAFSLTSIL
jgi:hypothetical protein